MVRKLIIAVVVLTFGMIPLSTALAYLNTETGPGCGLGKLLWREAEGKNKIVQQVLAATTNGTGMQTFGISSGTSDCTNDGVVKNDQKVPVFANVNFENLRQEMAQGRGEYLVSLATLLGVPADRRSEFFSLMQEKYATIFKSEQTTSSEMLIALNREMSAHPALLEAGGNR